MLKKTTSNLTAQKLRLLLLGSMALLIVIAGAIFIFTKGMLAQYAADVEKVSNTAESSSKNLTALSMLKTKLAEDNDAVERTRNLVAESQSYAYQDQIIKDITTFAQKSGVSISGFQFNSENTATAGSAATAQSQAGTSAATGQATTPQVSGLKTVSVSVNLKSPLEYKDIMDFVHMIEQNLTKMQLAGITMNRDAASDKVSVSSLTVEVYTR